MIQNDKAIGVLSAVPQKPGDPSFYVDINRVLTRVQQMMRPYLRRRFMPPPRTRISYDCATDQI